MKDTPVILFVVFGITIGISHWLRGLVKSGDLTWSSAAEWIWAVLRWLVT